MFIRKQLMAYTRWLIPQKHSILDIWKGSEYASVVPGILIDGTCTIYWPHEKSYKIRNSWNWAFHKWH